MRDFHPSTVKPVQNGQARSQQKFYPKAIIYFFTTQKSRKTFFLKIHDENEEKNYYFLSSE